jgi:hypothetical protein
MNPKLKLKDLFKQPANYERQIRDLYLEIAQQLG